MLRYFLRNRCRLLINLHTAKALAAVEKQVNLFTLPTSFGLHSPVVIYMVAVSVIAHISACSYVLRSNALEIARNQVRLNIGALWAFQEIMPFSQRTLLEMKTVARECLFSQILNNESQSEPIPPEDAPGFPDSLSWSSTLPDPDESAAN